MLVVVGGLPAAGKTTLCRTVARAIRAVHLRIDSIEQAVVDSGLTAHPVGAVGYLVAYALAADHLRDGLTVLADCVNPREVTRAAWRAAAARAGVDVLEVEVVCADVEQHRRRVATRVGDIPGLVLPSWSAVTGRGYEPWTRPHLVLDTSGDRDAPAAALRQAIEDRRAG